MSKPTAREIWFVTGSQSLYGEETLRQVASQSQVIAEALDAAPEIPVQVVWKPVLTDADAIRRLFLEASRGRRVHRAGRVDAHVLPGEDVDRRPGRARQAAAAPAHPGQRGAAVGDHRHGLHEPEPGGARGPGVRLHPDQARRGPQDGRRARVRPAGDRRGGHLGAGRGRMGGDPVAEAGPVRRQHALRRGDRGRQDRGRGRLRGVRSTPGASTTWSPPSTPCPTPTSTRSSPSTRTCYDVVPDLRAGGERHESLRYGASVELGAARRSSPAAGSARSPPTSRTSAGCASCPAWPCSG